MKRMFPLLMATVAALAILPLAAAEYDPDKPECPPDQMCTTSVNETGEDTGDGADAPNSFGPEDCIDCMQPPANDAQDGPTYADCGAEVCAYDESEAPADPESASNADALREAPFAGVALVLAGVAAVSLLWARHAT